MKLTIKIIGVCIAGWILLCLTVLVNYKLNLVYSGWAWAPAVTSGAVFLAGLAHVFKNQQYKLRTRLIISTATGLLFYAVGAWLWLLTACSQGDCL